jgi:Glyoxalase-like domain
VLRVDHAVYAVADLEAAAARFLDEHELASVPGGVHPRWGTGNRIVPLGSDYLELIAVVDPELAAGSRLGRAIGELAANEDRWFALCLADDDIEATAARLGLVVEAGSRTRPDGEVVAWRGAGIEDPRRTPDLPFFIAWDGPEALHPGSTSLEHPAGATGIAWAEVVGDPERLARWTAGATLPIRVVPGEPRVAAVALVTPGGDLVVD